ncbi:MAG: MBL fold metallo-hydrolase [Sulfurovum sp.]|uniref:MBL fold metallo-hydrolase n=1 Tax=Sulfurovum sp. TaxID=1969726 RepID=UPI002867B901|nr:MBL fold metallo-hydrolase [Sulfurovum sp.]MCO4845494.1 MBL fold metallo-hydrolase [Sulfurovum sp.]
MQLTFLGTSAGKPTRERNVSALALEFEQDNKWYLFDCGEATQHQILRSRLSIGKLDIIFISHMHGDHYYGLPGLLSSKKLDTAFRPLTVCGPKGIKKFLECVMNVSFENLGYKLKIIEFEAQETFSFDKFSLKILSLEHSIKSFAFYLKENDITNKLNEEKLRSIGLEPSPLYGELQRGNSIVFQGKKLEPEEFTLEPIEGRSLIIAGDNSRPDILGRYLEEIDLLVHECTYTQDDYDHLQVKVMHTTAKELGRVVQKRCVKNVIASHINPRYNKNSKMGVEVLYNEIKDSYKGRLFIASDFDIYRLDRNSIVEKL